MISEISWFHGGALTLCQKSFFAQYSDGVGEEEPDVEYRSEVPEDHVERFVSLLQLRRKDSRRAASTSPHLERDQIVC